MNDCNEQNQIHNEIWDQMIISLRDKVWWHLQSRVSINVEEHIWDIFRHHTLVQIWKDNGE